MPPCDSRTTCRNRPCRFCPGSVNSPWNVWPSSIGITCARASAASIASGRHRDRFRKGRGGRRSQHPVAGGTSPSGRAIRDEDCQRVRAAMARLTEGDRKLLAMRHIEALSMAQIATALGISEGAAKVRHIRALRRIQTFLEEQR